VSYVIKLEPDLESFLFEGEERIEVEVKRKTNCISLHSRELYIKDAHFTDSANKKQVPVELKFNNVLRTCTFVFEEQFDLGTGSLQIFFMGHLNDQMTGFYRSKYTDISGNVKYMASSQFEPLDARRCFPCWDEPSRKAVFSVVLIVPSQIHAFSNMPEKEINTLPNGKKEIIFMESPKMSTYLVAFCIGEFDFVQAYNAHGVLVKVYTPPGKSETGKFALQIGCDTLDLYNNFFRLPYPLPKLDMVAIPEFAMGAMENWGLVTYREVDLLIDERQASSQQKQRVCAVVAHELAHQWFGNLVTMAWWDDLWLNEGFATWMMTFAADHLHPTWRVWDQFIVDSQNLALGLDSLRTSHPIQVPIAHAEEVQQVFDAISYRKGACVVRLLAAVLGEEIFQKGLQLYMERHRYGNTETFHLWGAWQEVSGLPIQDIMKSWTEQMGYPVLEVVDEKWQDGRVELTLKQNWFLQDGSGVNDPKLWQIPLFIGTKHDPISSREKMIIMSDRTQTVEILLGDSSCEQNPWVKLNYGQHVPIRVKNSHAMLQALSKAVLNKDIPPADRSSLLMDSLALVKSGMLPVTELLLLLKSYEAEDDANVWEALSQILLSLEKLFMNDTFLHKKMGSFASKLVLPAIEKVGWNSQPTDGHLTKLMRASLVGLLSKFCASHPAVSSEARKRYDRWLVSPEDCLNLPSEYKIPVMKIVLINGGEQEFNEIIAYYDKADLIAEKKVPMLSLGSIKSPDLKKKVLQWAVSGKVKLQDFFYPMGSVSQSDNTGLSIAWEFFQSNLPNIKQLLATAPTNLMDAVIINCCSGFASEEKLQEVKSFFEENPLPNNSRKISNLLETIAINSSFLSRLKTSALTEESFWA